MATLAPSCASSSAIARPIPREAPVTSAALPSNRPMVLVSSLGRISGESGLPNEAPNYRCMVLNPLENRCDALSAADAHRYQGAFAADPLQFVQRFDGQDAAG